MYISESCLLCSCIKRHLPFPTTAFFIVAIYFIQNYILLKCAYYMVYPCVHVNKFHIKQIIFLPFAYFNKHRLWSYVWKNYIFETLIIFHWICGHHSFCVKCYSYLHNEQSVSACYMTFRTWTKSLNCGCLNYL
jgi:hypothetical protein